MHAELRTETADVELGAHRNVGIVFVALYGELKDTTFMLADISVGGEY